MHVILLYYMFVVYVVNVLHYVVYRQSDILHWHYGCIK